MTEENTSQDRYKINEIIFFSNYGKLLRYRIF
jgi:hypothetical protein